MPSLLDPPDDPYANPDLLGVGPRPDALADLYHAVTGYLTGSSKPTEPSWPIDNPVGTQSTQREPQLTMPRGEFDPIVDPSITRFSSRPITQSEWDRIHEAGIDLFNQAAILEGGEMGGGPRMFPARRVRPPGSPGPRSRAMPAEVPEVSPGPVTPAPPAGPAATVSDIGGGQRGMMAVPSLRSMTPADASVQAATDAHIIPKSDGGFVGAPTWVQTPEHLQQMRDRFDASIDAGAEGRGWYGSARNWISEVTGTPPYDPLTGASSLDPNVGFGSTGIGGNSGATPYGDPTAARRTAEGLAVFSPQANPDTNLTFYLQARNAYMRGEPLPLVRNQQQASKFNLGIAAKDEAAATGQPEPDIPQGPKTGPYAWHLSPDRPYGTTGVNDIWHARNFGYTNTDGSEFSGSPTEQQHMFMDYETVKAIDRANQRKAGGFDDWDAASIQAAPWVANKEVSLRKQYPNWGPERVRQEALSTYPDYAQRATAYMPHEQVPGKSTGLLDLLPEDQRDAFSAASTWRDPQTGRDMLTGNLFLQPRMANTQGTFFNSAGQFEMNPAQTAQPLIDLTPTVRPREIQPGTTAALQGTSSARGLLDMQEGTGVHYIDTRPDQNVSDMDSMRLLGQRPTPQQLEALSGIADRHGYALADTGDGVSMINIGRSAQDTPEGARPSPANGIELRDRLNTGMQDEINQALPGATTVRGRSQGPYVDLSSELAQSVKGEGRATDKVLADLENMRTRAPGMYDRLIDNPQVATKAQANLDRLTPEMQAARPDYVQLLKIVAGGRLKGLLEYARTKGTIGLPAALIGAYAASGSQQPDS